MSGIRRQRRSAEGWRALLTRFASRGQTVRAFCQHESVSPAGMMLVPLANTLSAWRSMKRPLQT